MSRIARIREKLRDRLHERNRQNRLYKHDHKRGHAKAGHQDAHAVRFLRRLLGKVIRRQQKNPTVMYDSVDLSQIPKNPPAVAGYAGGSWPTYSLLATQFPKARRLSIAISASENAECLDIESGDAVPAEAGAWVKRQKARGVKKPVVYGSVSSMGVILSSLAAAGVPRHEVRVWTAHYGSGKHICGPHSCGWLTSTTADATQWSDTSHGRNLDESLLSERFFA